jgi:hypothetical protein
MKTIFKIADPSCRTVWGVSLRPSIWRDHEFESHRGHECLCRVSVCVLSGREVFATDWSLVQRSPTECGVCLSVMAKPRQRGGPGPIRAVAPVEIFEIIMLGSNTTNYELTNYCLKTWLQRTLNTKKWMTSNFVNIVHSTRKRLPENVRFYHEFFLK